MSFLRRLILLAVAITPFAFISLAAGPTAKPTKDQIAHWIEQLGANDFTLREEASKKLYEAGEVAESALQEATGSGDAEVARRATEIMDKFKWGLYPEAPKEIVDLISRYRSSDTLNRTVMVDELVKTGPADFPILLKIVRADKNLTVRVTAFQEAQHELILQTPQWIAEKRYEALERLIDVLVAANLGEGDQYYAGYWLMRGQLNERIVQLQKTIGKGAEGKRMWELIANLYHAKGDLAAARVAAEKADNPGLVEALLLEDGQWRELAKRATNLEARSPSQSVGIHAAYCRLAGDDKEFEEALTKLYELPGAAPVDDIERIYYAKVLFLNDRPSEAVAVLAGSSDSERMAFEMLIAQGRYEAALDLANKTRNRSSEQEAEVEIVKARTLYLLGEKEKALSIFARYGDDINDKSDWMTIKILIESEARVGLRKQAAEHAARAAGVFRGLNIAEPLFPFLFPKNVETAESLWTILMMRPGQTPALAMKDLFALLEGTASPKLVLEVAKWAPITEGEHIEPTKAAKQQCAAAEAALACKNDPLARSLLEKVGSADALIRLGDLDADKKEWNKAEEWYARAWEKDRKQPLALYLKGWVLKQAGRDREGEKLMGQAHWLPLADSQVRSAFVKYLFERGQDEAVTREGELMLRLSQPGSIRAAFGMCVYNFATISRKDYSAAAGRYERAMLIYLDSAAPFSGPALYVGMPILVHRLRAEAYTKAGDFDAAHRESDLCYQALPGDHFVPAELVPMWDKAGHKKEATELFEKYLAVQEKLCVDYPKFAGGHNAIAWLSACCRRNLDSARKHALTAIALAPDNAGFLATLAEIEFQRGHRDAATAALKKAVAFEPKNVYFRKQLKRIEAGNPAADLPLENNDDE